MYSGNTACSLAYFQEAENTCLQYAGIQGVEKRAPPEYRETHKLGWNWACLCNYNQAMNSLAWARAAVLH